MSSKSASRRVIAPRAAAVVVLAGAAVSACGLFVSFDGYELVEGGDGGASSASHGLGGTTSSVSSGSAGNGGTAGATGSGGATTTSTSSSGSGGGASTGASGSGGSGGSGGFMCGGLDCDLEVPPDGASCEDIGSNSSCAGDTCKIATPTSGLCEGWEPSNCVLPKGDCNVSGQCCDGRTCYMGKCTLQCPFADGCSTSQCVDVGHDTAGVCWPPL